MQRSPRLLDDEGLRLAELLGELDEEKLEILVEKLSVIINGIQRVNTHKPQSPADRRYFTLSESSAGGEPLEIPSWVLSEGTRRMTAILALLLHKNPPPLLCMEEVENGLDPWTLRFLLDELAGAINRGTTQVILTTHSPYLLDMLEPENIILCDRKDYGVEFYAADRLPDTSTLRLKMGLGQLYKDQYLYRREDQKE
jgi:predicted ATPase